MVEGKTNTLDTNENEEPNEIISVDHSTYTNSDDAIVYLATNYDQPTDATQEDHGSNAQTIQNSNDSANEMIETIKEALIADRVVSASKAKPYWQIPTSDPTGGKPRLRIVGRYRRDETVFVREVLGERGWVEVTPLMNARPFPKGRRPLPVKSAVAKEWGSVAALAGPPVHGLRPLPPALPGPRITLLNKIPPPPPPSVPPRPSPLPPPSDDDLFFSDDSDSDEMNDACWNSPSSTANGNGNKKYKIPLPPHHPLNHYRDPNWPKLVRNQYLECMDWDLTWCLRFLTTEFAQMQPWQKVNFMPGIQDICKKDTLHRLIQRMKNKAMMLDYFEGENGDSFSEIRLNELRQQYREDERRKWDFWPEGFNLEDEAQFEELKQILEDKEKRSAESGLQETQTEDKLIYIIKRPGSSCGRGVHLVDSVEGLMHLTTPESSCYPLSQTKALAQRYIANVALIDGFKFTLRIYVAVTGVDPLRVYIYKEGLVRVCSQRYDIGDLKNVFSHIDSIDINGKQENQFNQKMSDHVKHDGLRVDFEYMKETVERDCGRPWTEIWEELHDLCARAIMSGEVPLTCFVTKFITDRSHAFELLGFDLLLDSSGKCWLLEINHTPSLAPHTQMENKVKKNMIRDLFSLIDCECLDKMKLKSSLLPMMLKVQKYQQENGLGEDLAIIQENSVKIIDLRSYNRQDIWVMIDLEMESERSGEWERSFPTAQSSHLSPYMLNNRNAVAISWLVNNHSYKIVQRYHDILNLHSYPL